MINRELKIQQAYDKLNKRKCTINGLLVIDQPIENKEQKYI
jgi:hypothetical protein